MTRLAEIESKKDTFYALLSEQEYPDFLWLLSEARRLTVECTELRNAHAKCLSNAETWGKKWDKQKEENERLDAELIAESEAHKATAAALMKENDRYREALESIAERDEDVHTPQYQIARAALEDEMIEEIRQMARHNATADDLLCMERDMRKERSIGFVIGLCEALMQLARIHGHPLDDKTAEQFVLERKYLLEKA